MAYRDVILANAAASFVILDQAKDMKEGVGMAAESIDAKKALDKLDEFIEFTKKLA